MKEAIVYLLAITVAEVVTAIVNPLLGIICHIAILLTVIIHSAIASNYPYRHLILALALAPLVRILSLSMPLAGIPVIWWYPIIYAPLLVAALVLAYILGYRGKETGLTLKFRLLPFQLVIALFGVIFGVTEYFILKEKVVATGFILQETPLLAGFLLLVCTGFVEEFIFRGVLQRAATEVFGWWGIVYISLIFAVLHMGFLSWIDVIFVFAVALFFGWTVRKTGTLVGVVLSHGITNIVLYLVAPLIF